MCFFRMSNWQRACAGLIALLAMSLFSSPALALSASLSTTTINIGAGATGSFTVTGTDDSNGTYPKLRWTIPAGLTVTQGATSNIKTFDINTASGYVLIKSNNLGNFSATINVSSSNAGTYLMQNTLDDFGISGQKNVTVKVTGGGTAGGLEYGLSIPTSIQNLCEIVKCPFITGRGDIPIPIIKKVETVNPIKIKLKVEVVELLQGDPAVTVKACGNNGNVNYCNETSSSSYSFDNPFLKDHCNNVAIKGFHWNAWGAVGNDTGTDAYQISLKNGWVIDNASYKRYVSSGDEVVSATPPTSTAIGNTTYTPSIYWNVSPNDHIAYCFRIWIKGPKGVPHY